MFDSANLSLISDADQDKYIVSNFTLLYLSTVEKETYEFFVLEDLTFKAKELY